MAVDRRTVMTAGAAAAGALAAGAAHGQAASGSGKLRRIATEEAWSFPEHLDALADAGKANWSNLDAQVINLEGSKAQNRIATGLQDTKERLAEMDRLGVDMQVLGLTSPGVQLFKPDLAAGLAALANDRLSEVVKTHPARFAGLASFAPQNPEAAAKEMERAVSKLGLSGFIVNSHTDGEYLDQEKFWPILEAANALKRPIYIHPRCPSDGMAAPFRDHRIQSAIWGYAMETGTHAMRLMVSGVFDRFPDLNVIIGHMGENIPFHLWRSDHWFERRADAYGSKRKPSELMKSQVMITTSGVEHGPALRYAIDVLGADRIMWAMDYPYERMAPSVEFMNRAALSEDERRAIYQLNAERVFNL